MKRFKDLQNELKNPDNRTKIILGAAFLVVAFIVILLNMDLKSLMPDLRNYKLRLREYESLQTQLAEAQGELLRAQQKSVQRNEVWIFVNSEDPRLAILRKLEGIAAECAVNLRTTGNLKDIQLANGVIGYELDVNADAAPFGNVCKFIIALSMSQPKFFLDNLTIKPSGGMVVLGGKLKVVVVTNRPSLDGYWGGGDA